MAITTAMPSSFKSELLAGAHCFGATLTPTGTTTSGSNTLTAISSLTGVSVGMPVSDSNGDIPANTVVAAILSSTSVRMSANATGTHAAQGLTFLGDIFKIALIKHTPSGTFGAASVNYSDLGADEVTGSGYSAGGLTLTSVSPAISGTTAYVTFGGTISWTSATLDVDGCMIYNSSARQGGSSGTSTNGTGRAVYLGDFGGRQQVTAGTFTVVMPTADATHALLRLQ